MSRNSNRSVAAEVAHIKNDIRGKDPSYVVQLYGIELRENNTVFDVSYNKSFRSLLEWVVFCNEQDEDDEYCTEQKYGKFNDEDY